MLRPLAGPEDCLDVIGRRAPQQQCAAIPTTSMSRLTGQSLDHEKPSCELPGAVAPVSATTTWWKAKNFSFSSDFFQNQVTLDCDLQAPSQKNDERLAGQVAHPRPVRFLRHTYDVSILMLVADELAGMSVR